MGECGGEIKGDEVECGGDYYYYGSDGASENYGRRNAAGRSPPPPTPLPLSRKVENHAE